jgi:hypothetical protein
MGRQHWEDLLVAAEYKRLVWSSKGTRISGGELLTGVRPDAGCRAIREEEENDDDGQEEIISMMVVTVINCTKLTVISQWVIFFFFFSCINTRNLLVALKE